MHQSKPDVVRLIHEYTTIVNLKLKIHKLLLYKRKPYTAQIKEQSTMRMVDRLLEKAARFSPCPVKRSSDSQGVYPVTQDAPIYIYSAV